MNAPNTMTHATRHTSGGIGASAAGRSAAGAGLLDVASATGCLP
jgi:hypothetical protein